MLCRHAVTDTAVRAAPRAWLFGDADFRRLWLVGVVVFAVRWLEMLAVAVFAYQRTGSPFIVGTTPVLCTYTDSVGDECDNTFSVNGRARR